MNDDAKKKILARRASFVAAALAGVTAACGKENAEQPQVCLSVAPMVVDADAPPPEPCLSVAMPLPDPPDAGPAPMPCLSTTAPQPPPPQVCLSVRADPDAGPRPQPQPCLSPMPPKPKP